MGDVQLMTLAYSFIYEKAMFEEEKRVMSKETNKPLWVRAELRAPHLVIRNLNITFMDPKLAEIYIAKQEQVIHHFEGMFILLGTENIHVY